MIHLWILVLTATMANVDAVTPTLWVQNTQEAFSKGEADGVTITRDGEVLLGPTLTEFADTGEEFVWAVAAGGQGRVYAGTGSEGRVYRLADGKADLVFDSPERAIFSLHVASNGTVYAGSSPGGLVYAIPPSGEPKTFARTEDQHVWAIVGDGKGGLYAATGGGVGRVVKITSGGHVETVLEASDPNVTSLARAADGTLYAGTDQNGLIYRVSPGGAVDVLYDTPENEVKALAVHADGRLIAGAMNSAGPSGNRPPPGGNGRNGGGKAPKGQAAVYEIAKTGSGWRLWDVPGPSVQGLAVRADGSITVLTGGKGRVYRLFPDGSHSVTTTVAEAEPWAFAPDGNGGGWIAASGTGQVFRLGSDPSGSGSLTSEPEDFALVSTWGRVAWEGESPEGTSVSFEVRSGNSEVPDETWSDWSKVGAGAIGVRAARYIQLRTNLTGDGRKSPTVREVMVSGLPENVRPLVIDLKVSGPHEEKSGGGGKNGGGRRGGSPPGESADGWEISWTGADANNDTLEYALHFRGRGETAWKLLAEDLSDSRYVWNTESAPEGPVQVRVTVSDAPSNPGHLAQRTERVSAPFVVDHTEPVVKIASVEASSGGAQVRASVSDATSFVRSAAVSVDSGDWEVVFPEDGVFDSADETIATTLSGLGSGEHVVVIRATDGRGNVGVAKRVFVVK